MTTLAALAIAAIGGQTASISDFIQRKFEDVSFTARKKVGNHEELAKISRDFGHSYRFSFTEVKFKEPFKLRIDSKVDDANVTMILNGVKQLISIPGVKHKSDLADSPGKRQTPLDFGFLTPSMFDGLFVAKFVRVDRSNGDYVFDINFAPSYDYKVRHRVWLDKEKKYITKREWYNKSGRQMATFFYENPKLAGGIWLPTRLTVRNMDNKVAGVSEYEQMKVNTGISDAVFKI